MLSGNRPDGANFSRENGFEFAKSVRLKILGESENPEVVAGENIASRKVRADGFGAKPLYHGGNHSAFTGTGGPCHHANNGN